MQISHRGFPGHKPERTIGAFQARISENTGTNGLVLTVVPEPGVTFLAMVGLAGLLGFRCRRAWGR